MVYEVVPWEQSLALDLPNGEGERKRRRTEYSWESQDLPQVPIMINTKAIPKHTQLLILMPDKA